MREYAMPLPSGRALMPLSYEGLICRRFCADSRLIQPGDTFLAYPGNAMDGRDFIGAAIERGAAHVLWERHGFDWSPQWTLPHRSVVGLRAQVGHLAGALYGHPSQHLAVWGVTGTNGKTTCSHWLAQILEKSGQKTTVVGTLGSGFLGHLALTQQTTPDPVRLQALLAEHVALGADHCVMEVSSHALDQERVAGVTFKGALFTNLTRDHLDYHGSIEAYGAAKIRLFRDYALHYAVLNLDDAFAAQLLTILAASGTRVLGYTCTGATEERCPERLVLQHYVCHDKGMAGEVMTPWGSLTFDIPVLGTFNLSNMLAVLGAALLEGVTPAQYTQAISQLKAPLGRLQSWAKAGLPRVVVDFAHTPDALAQALQAVRPWVRKGGKLWLVFGCGGGRDKGKRPLMGEVASLWADRVVLTSDNPRDENPQTILQQIQDGMKIPPYLVESDRSLAIHATLTGALAEDVVLIAGKGHETDQILAGGEKKPWSDGAAVQSWFEGRLAS